MFNHVDIDLPKLSRETIDGVRYYSVPDEEELLKLVSITSVTSHFNKEIQFDIIEENDNKFKYWLDRYKYYDRYPENNRDYYRAKCDRSLTRLNQLLEKNQYLLTNKFIILEP